MTDTFIPNSKGDDNSSTDPTDAPTVSEAQPWVSRLAIAACICIFFGLTSQNDYESWESVAKWGYLPATAIWDGAYWALLTSVFVHYALWHLAFNVYWLWVLGSQVERSIGSLRFLALFVASAFVSSSFQLAVSDDTGIGASGVVYAIFGLAWVARYRFPRLKEVLDKRTIYIFIIWLLGCFVATQSGVWEVGNAAHTSGLLFGVLAGGYFVPRLRPRLVLVGLAAMFALSIVPLFWCPWSVLWLSTQAYNAHAARQYDRAIERYSQVIRMEPDNAWAYYNRSTVYEELDEPHKAQEDRQKALAIDPSIWESE